MLTESDFTKIVCNELKRCRATVFTFVAGAPGQTDGTPDRYVSHPYWQGFIEFKGYRTPIAPLQKVHHNELNRHKPGQAAFVRIASESHDYLVLVCTVGNRSGHYRWELESNQAAIGFLKLLKELSC